MGTQQERLDLHERTVSSLAQPRWLWDRCKAAWPLQHEWRVLELECFLLQSGKIDGVVESGHVHQHRHAMLLSCFGDFLSK